MESKLTEQELSQVKTAKLTVDLRQMEAAKFSAIARVTELEFENLILKIYMKYGLTPGVDQVMEDGTIVRSKEKQE
jgi:hypothetical protein